jgi:hypothetical protein
MIGSEFAILTLLSMVTSLTALALFTFSEYVGRKRWVLRVGIAAGGVAFAVPMIALRSSSEAAIVVLLSTAAIGIAVDRCLQLCRRCGIALYRHNRDRSSMPGLCNGCVAARMRSARRIPVLRQVVARSEPETRAA